MERKILLAVSGGLDSMVLLDVMSKCLTTERLMARELVVAHFNHGIRGQASDEDEQMVRARAEELGVECVVGRARLGRNASEALARKVRYDFLLNAACQAEAELWTAQHFDDVIETMAINLARGTGWRGLTGMSRADVIRPLIETERLPEKARQLLGVRLGSGSELELRAEDGAERELGAELEDLTRIVTRRTLVRYAAKEGVEFREDASNHDGSYLRGRTRERLLRLDEAQKQQLAEIFQKQKATREEIELMLDGMIDEKMLAKREWAELEPEVAIEMIKELGRKNQLRLMQAEAERLLVALKTLPKGKKVNLRDGKLVEMRKDGFYLTF